LTSPPVAGYAEWWMQFELDADKVLYMTLVDIE
jgi:hypothetical protein